MILLKGFRIGKFRDRKQNGDCQRPEKVGHEVTVKGYRVLVWDNEAADADSGDGICTTL